MDSAEAVRRLQEAARQLQEDARQLQEDARQLREEAQRLRALAGQMQQTARDLRAAPLAAPSLALWRTHLAQDTQQAPATINRALAAVKRVVKEGAAQGQVSADTAAQFAGVAGVKAKALRDRQRAHARTRISPED